MASTIVNVTLLKVIEELENILESDLDQSDQKALTDPELRQKLISFVLNRMPNRYLTIESEKVASITSRFVVFTTQEKLKIENLIHQGISHLLPRDKKYNFPHPYKDIELMYYHLN
jgi:hypothetical protein